jgi:hypothetical protein
MIREAVLAAGVVTLAACAGDIGPGPQLATAGNATKDNSTKDAAHGGPLPANYRQMFAEYVAAYARTKPNFAIHDAFISKPFDKWGGLFRGGTMTTVCVQVMVENKLLFPGHDASSDFFMTVKDGQVDDLAPETGPCSDLSPFPELLQLIQR